MIECGEIEQSAKKMGVHVAHVQRDYVFGWLLKTIFEDSYLGPLLVLKGATCLRKIYLPESRYSDDLDFSSETKIDEDEFARALNRCCLKIEGITAVKFHVERTNVGLYRALFGRNEIVREVYRARLFFADFYGNPDELSISVQMDISTFDTPILPIKILPFDHPYSDRFTCHAEVKCLAAEELLAVKLKCLLQRRHVLDVFDVAYAHVLRNKLNLDRGKILSAFLKKTIFERSPFAAREILLAVPTDDLENEWSDRLVCPSRSWFGLGAAADSLTSFVREIFYGANAHMDGLDAFFPAALRFPILRAGSERRLIRLTYDGSRRLVESYALSFKTPSDSAAREYFYCWNLEGGSSPPGWRSLLGHKISTLELTDTTFEPRVEIQLSKAAERPSITSFARGENTFHRQGPKLARVSPKRSKAFSLEFVLQCPYCQKKFKRASRDSTLRPHKTPGGYPCGARRGVFIT